MDLTIADGRFLYTWLEIKKQTLTVHSQKNNHDEIFRQQSIEDMIALIKINQYLNHI